MNGEPRFLPPERGVMVLDTVSGTPGHKAGLRPGDILLELAGLPVNNGYELARALSYAPDAFTFAYSRAGTNRCGQAAFTGGERRLGVIIVPEGYEQHYVQLVDKRYGLIDWLLRKLRK